MEGKLQLKTYQEMAEYIETHGVKYVDACFADPLGQWHHFTFAPSMCEKSDLEDGWAFDGSSIRLFKAIQESDMYMHPDVSTCWIDPFMRAKTLHVTCDVRNPNGSRFDRCTRSVMQRCEEYVAGTGLADSVFIGPEAEFFVFDNVSYGCSINKVHAEVDGHSGYWNTEKQGGNLAHRAIKKGYYAPSAPVDQNHDIREQMLTFLEELGINIEKHHSEVAACQCELGIECDTPLKTADNLMTYKYVVKNVAVLNNKTATFMPKPIAGDNGSGMHLHVSLWKEGHNIFFDENSKYCNLSKEAHHFIAGILNHARSILAFTNPTTNSYKRLVPGYEAPVLLSFSRGNRSAAIRIPVINGSFSKKTRMEFRCPDPSANPYLAISAIVMAGVDGMKKQLEPPTPLDKNTFDMKSCLTFETTPESLEEALRALEEDHEYLLEGEVFAAGFVSAYVTFKREEARAIQTVPHPKEFEYYYSA